MKRKTVKKDLIDLYLQFNQNRACGAIKDLETTVSPRYAQVDRKRFDISNK